MAAAAAPGSERLDFERLLLVRGRPDHFARQLPQIRTLREQHYLHNEPFGPERTSDEKLAFAGIMNVVRWMDPTKGRRATPAQRHRHHRVVAAIDRETHQIEGYAYVTVNDSSKYELRLRKHAVLRPFSVVVGALERTVKRRRHPEEHTYAYIHEIVRRPGQPETLENVLGAAALIGYEDDETAHVRKGTHYPKSEQTPLIRTLRTWGFRHDGGEPLPGRYFGDDAPVAFQERWVTQDIGVTADAMLYTAGRDELPPVKELTEAL